MPLSDREALDVLARVVVEDAETACRREEDKAANEARRLVLDAEERVDALRRASHDLGRARGEAVETVREQEADREIESVRDRAFDALWERFEQRLLMRLRDLPGSERYGEALSHWARVSAERMDRPADVFASRRDRAAVYEALLEAGAQDFHVRVDHDVHVGFVVRDLDGRTVSDCRPEALLEAAAGDMRALLEARVRPFAADASAKPTSS
jgi:vacuolar-type H+-ATPase subunit E/Vma4